MGFGNKSIGPAVNLLLKLVFVLLFIFPLLWMISMPQLIRPTDS